MLTCAHRTPSHTCARANVLHAHWNGLYFRPLSLSSHERTAVIVYKSLWAKKKKQSSLVLHRLQLIFCFFSLPRRHEGHVSEGGHQPSLLRLAREDVIPSPRERRVANVVRAHEPVVDASAVPREIFVAPPVVVRLDVVRAAAVGGVAIPLQLRRLHPRRRRGVARHADTVYAVGEGFVYALQIVGPRAGFFGAGLAFARGGDLSNARLGRG